MNENYQGDELSFLNDSEHQTLAPIAGNQPFQKNPVFYEHRQQTTRTTNALINVLSPNRNTNKL